MGAQAEVRGYDKHYYSPFAKNAIEVYKKDEEHYIGGKPDDITVVVG
jgi:hypothetical protein